MKVFSGTWRDVVRFDVKPNEDALLVSKKAPVFAVADGVTQSHYPNGRYALPYGAKTAARLFCRTVVRSLEQTKPQSGILKNVEMSPRIRLAFDEANREIKMLNEKHGINDRTMDYVTHDWFDTVGVAALMQKNILHYGFVGDCGLVIFNKHNEKVFQTKDMVQPAVAKFQKAHPHQESMLADQRTLIMHRDWRNRADKKGYGSFTGEANVSRYYAIGTKKLTKGDMVVLYSDGFFHLLKDKQCIALLRQGNKKAFNRFVMQKAKEDPKHLGDDRTVITVTI